MTGRLHDENTFGAILRAIKAVHHDIIMMDFGPQFVRILNKDQYQVGHITISESDMMVKIRLRDYQNHEVSLLDPESLPRILELLNAGVADADKQAIEMRPKLLELAEKYKKHKVDHA